MEHPPSHPQSFEDKPFRLALSDLLTYCTPSASSRKYNLVQLVLYAADAVVLYYYVATTVYPVPGGILNSDDGWWTEYALFTFTFGFIIGFRAVLGMATFFHSLLAPWRLVEYYELCRRSNAYFYAVFTPLYLLFTTLGTIVPFFGGWFLPPLVHAHAWDHACDQYPMFAILVINLGTTSNTHFYSTNNATRLFTFNITASDNNPTNGYSEEFPSLVFALQDVYTAMPPASYPLLRSVQYNMILNKTVGYCAPAINDTSVTPSPQCMSGNFTADDDVLRFHIDTPLSPDWTQAQNWSQPGSPTASMAFEVGTFTSEAWTRPGHPPGATIREGGRHGHVVLKTVVTKPGDWTQLKVCIAGPRQATPELLHPEVLVPLGVLLMRQSDYAIEKAGLEPPLASY